MKKYLNGKLYINTTELSSMFTKSYGFKVTPRDINHVCGHYKLPKQEFNNMIFYNATLVEQMRTMKEDFMYVLTNIVKYGDARGVDAYTNNVNKAVETDMNYEESNESDMEYANNELLNKYQFENKKGKLVKITEEQRKRLFNENVEDEGGTYYVNSLNDKDFNATYDFDKNKSKLDVDFSKLNLRENPLNNNWIEVPNNWNINSKNLKNIPNKLMPTFNDYSNFIINSNKIYMPKVQNFGNGDNIGFSVNGKIKKTNNWVKLNVINPKTNQPEEIKCFNTSLLGDINPTFQAHFYKGKAINYNFGDYKSSKMLANTNRNNASVPNFNSQTSKKSYIDETIKLIKNDPILSSFEPNYILYPESRSIFNNTIAMILKKYIWPNAIVPENGGLKKMKVWNINYKALYGFTEKEIYGNKTFVNRWKKEGQLTELTMKTLMKRFYDYLGNNIRRGLSNSINFEEYSSNPKVIGEQIMDYIWDSFVKEYDKLDASIRELQKEKVEKYYNKLRNDARTTIQSANKAMYDIPDKINLMKYKTSDEQAFLRTARVALKPYFKQNNIESYFSSYSTLEKLLTSGSINFNLNKIEPIKTEKDSISKYDNETRNSVSGQFASTIELNPNATYLVIDDNLATGVSLRNACQVLIDNNIKSENIIAMTPGDMGTAGYGAAMSGEIPVNSAEGEMIGNLAHGYNKNARYNDRNFTFSRKDKEELAKHGIIDNGKLNAIEKSALLRRNAAHNSVDKMNQAYLSDNNALNNQDLKKYYTKLNPMGRNQDPLTMPYKNILDNNKN